MTSLDEIRKCLFAQTIPLQPSSPHSSGLAATPSTVATGIGNSSDYSSSPCGEARNAADNKFRDSPLKERRKDYSNSHNCQIELPSVGLAQEWWSKAATIVQEFLAQEEKSPKLSLVAEELLIISAMICRRRAEAIETVERLRSQCLELEYLLDSAKQREREHHYELGQVNCSVKHFEKKYNTLLGRAKQHCSEAQTKRDESYRLALCKQRQTSLLEEETQRQLHVMEDLKCELNELKQHCEKAVITDRDLANLRLKQRQLENRHGSLATEKARLQRQLDLLQNEIMHKKAEISPHDGNQDDNTFVLASANLGPMPSFSPLSPRESDHLQALQRKAEDLASDIAAEQAQLSSKLATSETEAAKYKEYAKVLLSRVEVYGDV